MRDCAAEGRVSAWAAEAQTEGQGFFTVYVAAGAGKLCPDSTVDAIVHFDGVEH